MQGYIEHTFEIAPEEKNTFTLLVIVDFLHDYWKADGGQGEIYCNNQDFFRLCNVVGEGLKVHPRTCAALVKKYFDIRDREEYPSVSIDKMETKMRDFGVAHMPSFIPAHHTDTLFMADTCRTSSNEPSCRVLKDVNRLIATPTIVDTGFMPKHIDYDAYYDRKIEIDNVPMSFRIIDKSTDTQVSHVEYRYDTDKRDIHGFLVHYYQSTALRQRKQSVPIYLLTSKRDKKYIVREFIPKKFRKLQMPDEFLEAFDILFTIFMGDFAQLLYARDRYRTQNQKVVVSTNDTSMSALALIALKERTLSSVPSSAPPDLKYSSLIEPRQDARL
jgi:hypothetical protein